LLPRSFAGRLTLLLILALLIAQGIAFVLFSSERIRAVRHAYQENVVTRTAGVLRLLEETQPALHDQVARDASTPFLRFWLAPESAAADGTDGWLAGRLADELAEALGVDRRRVRVGTTTARPRRFGDRERDDDWDRDDDDDDEARMPHRHRNWHRDRHRHRFVISVALADGQWLNGVTGLPPRPPGWGAPFMLTLVLSALAVVLVAVLVARRLTRPMRRLAEAADKFGRGEAITELAEEGPLEARRTIQAFNEMRERLERFVRDRTTMLAAISHDLRTPITSLRLRAELISDEEAREKILETLDEMQHMTDATLAFARAAATSEETRSVDVAALVDSVTAELADLGQDVAFEGAEKTVLACRPHALGRALRNLIENAVAYGKRARVRLEDTAEELRIAIEDEGPGIAEADRERVFEPFVRLEASRSRETGGVGLGLAIARTIVRNHGGDIVLENRTEGGLRVIVRLPRAAAGR
jgi:signal transduction histidine kinase